MKKHRLYLLLLLICSGCVEEIDLGNFATEAILVVEANLTNELKHHAVKLSRTTFLDSLNSTPEVHAIVRIKDDQQRVFEYTEMSDGLYRSTQAFKAVTNTNYTLEITTSEGETYSSTPQKIEAINDIDDLKIELESDKYNDEGIRVYVSSESQHTKANYYKYTYEETYIVKAPYWSPYILKIGNSPTSISKTINPEAQASKICYKTENSQRILQTETQSLSTNSVTNFPVLFVKKTNAKIWHRYSLLVRQFIQSYEAYAYHKTLQKLSISEGIFSQVQQGFILGNIDHISNTDKKVVGFFEVNSVSQKRLFFNFIDLFPNHGLLFTKDCLISAPKLSEPEANYPLYDALTIDKLVYARDNEVPTTQLPGPFKVTSKECADCRYTASNIKPSFWID